MAGQNRDLIIFCENGNQYSIFCGRTYFVEMAGQNRDQNFLRNGRTRFVKMAGPNCYLNILYKSRYYRIFRVVPLLTREVLCKKNEPCSIRIFLVKLIGIPTRGAYEKIGFD